MMSMGAKCACPGGHIGLYKTTFSEYVHVAYQIKGNEVYNNMHTSILSLNTPLTPVVGSTGHFSFLKFAYQINGNEA